MRSLPPACVDNLALVIGEAEQDAGIHVLRFGRAHADTLEGAVEQSCRLDTWDAAALKRAAVLMTSSRREPVRPLESSRPGAQIPDAVRFPDRVSPCPIMSVPILTAEPPPARIALSYVVGQDCRGRWVALESHGLGGGYFRSREAAIRYAAAESGCPAGAVRLSPEPLAIIL